MWYGQNSGSRRLLKLQLAFEDLGSPTPSPGEQAWPHALGVAAAMSWAKVEADVITRNAARAPAGA